MRMIVLAAALTTANAPAAHAVPALAATVEVHAQAARIPGLVAVSFDAGGAQTRVSFGDCAGRPISADTSLLIGSVSKTLTAQLILRLAATGRIALGAPAAAYVPGLAPDITVTDLLSHRSGYTRAQGMRFDPDAPIEKLKPAGVRGTYAYSNLNYVLLGKIAERVTSTSFDRALADHVAAPAGMTRTVATGAGGAACGHAIVFGVSIPRAELPWPAWSTPAGFVTTTGGDMARFGASLLRRLRGGEPAERMLIGWHRATIGGEDVWSHSGATGSFRATIVLIPARDRGFVLIADMGGWIVDDPIDRLAVALVASEQGRPSPPPRAFPWERLARFAMLILLFVECWRLRRRVRRETESGLRPSKVRLAVAAAVSLAVPAIVIRFAGLTVADFWRLAPDVLVFVCVAPALAASRQIFTQGMTRHEQRWPNWN